MNFAHQNARLAGDLDDLQFWSRALQEFEVVSSCPGSRNLEGLLDEYTFDHVQDMVHLSRLLVDDPAANPMKFVQFSSSSGTGRHALGVSVSTKDDAETTVITDPDEQAELLTTPLSVFDETSGKLIMAGKRSANFWNEALHRLSFTSTSQDLAVTGSAKRGNCTALVVQSMPLLLNKEPQTTLTTAKQFIVTYKHHIICMRAALCFWENIS